MREHTSARWAVCCIRRRRRKINRRFHKWTEREWRREELSEEIKSELWDYGGGWNLPIIFYVLCVRIFFQLHRVCSPLWWNIFLFAFWSKQIATQLSHDCDSCFADSRELPSRVFTFDFKQTSNDILNYSRVLLNK